MDTIERHVRAATYLAQHRRAVCRSQRDRTWVRGMTFVCFAPALYALLRGL